MYDQSKNHIETRISSHSVHWNVSLMYLCFVCWHVLSCLDLLQDIFQQTEPYVRKPEKRNPSSFWWYPSTDSAGSALVFSPFETPLGILDRPRRSLRLETRCGIPNDIPYRLHSRLCQSSRCRTTNKPIMPSITIFNHGCSLNMIVT